MHISQHILSFIRYTDLEVKMADSSVVSSGFQKFLGRGLLAYGLFKYVLAFLFFFFFFDKGGEVVGHPVYITSIQRVLSSVSDLNNLHGILMMCMDNKG